MGPAEAEAAHDEPAQRPPGIWIFIALDCTSFGLLFLVFMVERFSQSRVFDVSARMLDVRLGLANTLILITSSWIVARANHSGRDGDLAATRRWLLLAIAVASGFGIIKTFEYVKAIGRGMGEVTTEFFTFYFALTGVHLFHYLIGMAVLAYLASQADAGEGTMGKDHYIGLLNGGALYWHMVDLLWVSLFAMLYLVGAR